MPKVTEEYKANKKKRIWYHCYNKNLIAQMYDARAQHRVLAKTVNYLLGAEE